jgi:CubicO group peptidase (beta-lactamase class C family)
MEPHAPDTGTSLKTSGPSPTLRSKTSGLSPTRLARMHDTLLHHVDSGRLSGLVALISRRGEEHVDAIGKLAFDRTAPMRRDTIFRLDSVTKPITAVSALLMAKDTGLMRLCGDNAAKIVESKKAEGRDPWLSNALFLFSWGASQDI